MWVPVFYQHNASTVGLWVSVSKLVLLDTLKSTLQTVSSVVLYYPADNVSHRKVHVPQNVTITEVIRVKWGCSQP